MTSLYKGEGVTIDASGNGVVEFTVPSGYRWTVSSQSVLITAVTTRPTVRVYVNGQFREGTYSGMMSSSDSVIDLNSSDTITAEWSGATAGVRATYRIWGRQDAI